MKPRRSGEGAKDAHKVPWSYPRMFFSLLFIRAHRTLTETTPDRIVKIMTNFLDVLENYRVPLSVGFAALGEF